MIAPRTIADMIAKSSLETTKTAIIAEFKRLLKGVTVVGHPGKLDIDDVVAKAVVQAPGVAIGWSRARSSRDIDGGYQAPVEWAAYIVVEDYALRETNERIDRETLGHAIGATILDILNDPDLSTWGVVGLDAPLGDPAPALTPMFTAKSFEGGTAYYVVTWTQVAWDQGVSLFGGETPELSMEDGAIEAELPEDDVLPTEIRAMFRDDVDGGA